jgi:hypothetical protein
MAEEQTETTETETAETTEATTTEQTASSTDETASETAETSDDTTALGIKAKEEGAETTGAPEAYDVKAPEGREFDKETFDAVAPELKELGLSNDAAQKLVDAYAGKVLPIIEARYAKQAEEASQTATATLKADWLAEAQKDAEVGGAKWDETLHLAATVFDKVGLDVSNPFRVILEDSGLGNNVEALRFMRRLGTLIAEDKFERGDGNPGTTDVPIWDKVYGTPTQAEA